MFINRQTELAYLDNEYHDIRFKFISIIGRRRVGKTTLIRKDDLILFGLKDIEKVTK